MWESSANTALYRDWLGSYAEGILWKGGLWNDNKLRTWLDAEVDDIGPMLRYVDVGLTDLL